MENTMPAPPRYYGSELISIKLKRRDVIFIGQTISKYPVDGIAEFLKIINKTVKESDVIDEDFLNEIVEIKITVNLLFDIHNKLGAEQEFFYADFNATIAVQLTAMISELFSTDVDLAT